MALQAFQGLSLKLGTMSDTSPLCSFCQSVLATTERDTSMNTAQASSLSSTDFLTYCRGQVRFSHWFSVQGLVLSPTGQDYEYKRVGRFQSAGDEDFLSVCRRPVYTSSPPPPIQYSIKARSSATSQNIEHNSPPDQNGKNPDMTQTTSSATDLSPHMVAAGGRKSQDADSKNEWVESVIHII
jgi:hypothetical protein